MWSAVSLRVATVAVALIACESGASTAASNDPSDTDDTDGVVRGVPARADTGATAVDATTRLDSLADHQRGDVVAPDAIVSLDVRPESVDGSAATPTPATDAIGVADTDRQDANACPIDGNWPVDAGLLGDSATGGDGGRADASAAGDLGSGCVLGYEDWRLEGRCCVPRNSDCTPLMNGSIVLLGVCNPDTGRCQFGRNLEQSTEAAGCRTP